MLSDAVPDSEILRGSVVALDGFTGFTPVQDRLLGELLKVCSKVYVTVEMDERRIRSYTGIRTSFCAQQADGDIPCEDCARGGRGGGRTGLPVRKAPGAFCRQSGDGISGGGTVPVLREDVPKRLPVRHRRRLTRMRMGRPAWMHRCGLPGAAVQSRSMRRATRRRRLSMWRRRSALL